VKQTWTRAAAKLDAMSVRERVLVFAAGAAVVLFVLWLVLLKPMADRNRELTAQADGQKETIAALEAQKRELMARVATNPDAELLRQIEEVDRQLSAVDASINAMQSGLIQPDRMTALVKGVIGQAPRLQLVAMRTLPPTPLVEAGAHAETAKPGEAKPAAAERKEAGIFKHGIEITLEGRYLDLLAYAAQLERMPTRVMWNRTRIDATEYPRVTMTLTLYTLSLERTWLTI
jgi:MSHA biogenesis protein MshJ